MKCTFYFPTLYANEECDYQNILITASSNRSDLKLLLDASEDYIIPQKEAATIIHEVVTAVKHWDSIARRLGIAKREKNMFSTVFSKHSI